MCKFFVHLRTTGKMSVRSPCHLCPPLQILDRLPDGYEIYEDFAIERPQKSFLTVDNNRWVKSVTHQAEAILKSEMYGK